MSSAGGFVKLDHVDLVRGERQVLFDVSLSIDRGECVALLGPNGCGKSSLLKVLTCELYPLARPETRVELLGLARWDVTELKRQLGVVQAELPGRPMLSIPAGDAVLTGFFSSSTLWPHLAVTDAMRARAEAVMLRAGIADLRQRIFGELSAGQQRRVLIARALVASAGCLLLDEPANALDLYAQRELRELLEELGRQGTTLLLVTHHIADIGPTFGRVIAMQEGRLVDDGPRETMLTAGRLGSLFNTRVDVVERGGWYSAF